MKNKSIIIFTLVVVVIIAGFFLFNSFLKKNVIKPEVKTPEKTAERQMASLSVPQQAGGDNVFIEKSFLPEGGYVVIHSGKDGNVGGIIGESKLLPAGSSDNFLMKINETVVKGDVLFAMLHSSDGDGKFDPTLDTPILGNEGKPVVVKFDIVSEGELNKGAKL